LKSISLSPRLRSAVEKYSNIRIPTCFPKREGVHEARVAQRVQSSEFRGQLWPRRGGYPSGDDPLELSLFGWLARDLVVSIPALDPVEDHRQIASPEIAGSTCSDAWDRHALREASPQLPGGGGHCSTDDLAGDVNHQQAPSRPNTRPANSANPEAAYSP
jgi:hypothetical protein